MQRRTPLRTQRQADPGAQRLQEATGDALRPVQRDKRRREHHRHIEADAAAADVTEERPLFHFDSDERLSEVSLTTKDDIPKDAAAYATLVFFHRDGIGGDRQIVVQYATSSGAILAWRPKVFRLTSELPIGGVLSYLVSKAGAGQIVPDSVVRAVTVEVAP